MKNCAMRELLLTYKHEAHITPSVSFSVIPKACKTGSVAFRWTSAISLFCFGFFIYLLGLWMSYIAWKYTDLHCLNIWMFTELSYRGETFGWKLNRDLYDEILPCRYCFFFSCTHSHRQYWQRFALQRQSWSMMSENSSSGAQDHQME